MTLKIHNLTAKNFMSIGNATQAVDFNRDDLTLVLGANLDLGGDNTGARNGTGKTTIINALSYAFYGSALTKIKVNNLINKTNTKGMVVAVEFEVSGISYRIERGRKPTFLRFYVNDEEQMYDDYAQGDSRKTQEDIEKLLHMSHDMFKHLVALNTYTEPFLSMRAADQRSIIEQLLGITLLSEKALALKEQVRESKDKIKEEEYRINAILESNAKIQDSINNLKRRSGLWEKSHNNAVDELKESIEELEKINITDELAAWEALRTWEESEAEYSVLNKEYNHASTAEKRAAKVLADAEADLNKAKNEECPTCGAELHSHDHDELLNNLEKRTDEARKHHVEAESRLNEIVDLMEDVVDPGDKPTTVYSKEQDAFNHQTTLGHLKESLSAKEKEVNPYSDQVTELENEALTEVSYDALNAASRMKDHQDMLMKLLTNKDSYIRKRIIDQNLSFLNNRLGYYIDKIGLPHTVEFQNDLTVEISEFGRDLDFDNLSRGERNRLILGLSWAFRDVWEHLYQPINLLFIDELMDSGMDSVGVDKCLSALKKMSRERNKSIWLVSHKDDLSSRVNNILTVVKENGYTSYSTDVDVIS